MTDEEKESWRIVVEESRHRENFFDEAILAADAELTALRGEVELLRKVTHISIPTETMEQEFQKHYRRGYEAGTAALRGEVERLKGELDIETRLRDRSRLSYEKLWDEAKRYREAVNLPGSFHTCGHHPQFVCAACEVKRRAGLPTEPSPGRQDQKE